MSSVRQPTHTHTHHLTSIVYRAPSSCQGRVRTPIKSWPVTLVLSFSERWTTCRCQTSRDRHLSLGKPTHTHTHTHTHKKSKPNLCADSVTGDCVERTPAGRNDTTVRVCVCMSCWGNACRATSAEVSRTQCTLNKPLQFSLVCHINLTACFHQSMMYGMTFAYSHSYLQSLKRLTWFWPVMLNQYHVRNRRGKHKLVSYPCDSDLYFRVKVLLKGRDSNTQNSSVSTKRLGEKLLRWCDALLLTDPVHGGVVCGPTGGLIP